MTRLRARGLTHQAVDRAAEGPGLDDLVTAWAVSAVLAPKLRDIGQADRIRPARTVFGRQRAVEDRRAVVDLTPPVAVRDACVVRDLVRSPTEDDLLLLADAQISAGLLVVGELPGYPVVGHTVVGRGIEVRRRDSPAET